MDTLQTAPDTSNALIIPLNAVIKGRIDADRRLIEIQASSEDVDAEGDVVLQKALLDSATSFIASGHADIDHLSEIGARLGLQNPSSYIIGRPIAVSDMGGQRTSVTIEIMRSLDGQMDVAKNKYDEFWKSLQSTPPVHWSASIYGFPFPDAVDDCSEVACSHGATRYVIKGLDWRSIAVTRNPVNQSLTGHARIITAKAHIDELLKAQPDHMPKLFATGKQVPRSMDELWGQYERHISKDCMASGGSNSRMAFKDHFIGCCGMEPESADIMAHALMMSLVDRHKRRGSPRSV